MWIWNEGLVMWYKIAQSQKTIDEMRKKFEQAFPNNKPGSFSKMNFPQMNFQKGTGAFGTQQTPGIKTQLQTNEATFSGAYWCLDVTRWVRSPAAGVLRARC